MSDAPALAASSVLSWRGHTLRGDVASIAEVRRLIYEADERAQLHAEVLRLRGVVLRMQRRD